MPRVRGRVCGEGALGVVLAAWAGSGVMMKRLASTKPTKGDYYISRLHPPSWKLEYSDCALLQTKPTGNHLSIPLLDR